MSLDKLFRPLQVGHAVLQHRIVMAPLTRMRADEQHVPSSFAKEYYAQRASTPGTMIVTEAAFISPCHGGCVGVPGIWSQAQINSWREIVDAVHDADSIIWFQLWALGRVAEGSVLKAAEGGPFEVYAPSAVSIDASQTNADSGMSVPLAMSEEDIQFTIKSYAAAARNAMSAGFDGVEIHGANGFLVDQFWQDVSNVRSDQWGGSIENRARFGLEVTKAVIEAVGDSRKVGMRLSPWGKFQGMGMKDPVPQFEYIIRELKSLDIAYLHLNESRILGSPADGFYHDNGTIELKHFIDIWGDERPIILAGGFTSKKAKWVIDEIATGDNIALAFGRLFISTPDLPYRIQNGIEPNQWDQSTFYTPGPQGYTDYPFSKEWISEHEKTDARLYN